MKCDRSHTDCGGEYAGRHPVHVQPQVLPYSAGRALLGPQQPIGSVRATAETMDACAEGVSMAAELQRILS